MSAPSAKVIADSVSPEGRRLTTFEVRAHRFILAEFNTHRVFSRNSASSRAIPVKKQIDRVEEDLAYPVAWPAEQRGMQGGDELAPDLLAEAKAEWRDAAMDATFHAENLSELGLHKSLCNRIIEPYMWHTIVVSATAWENFFRQRVSPLAQPEIQSPAEAMFEAYNASTPKLLVAGDWHLPYVDHSDWVEAPQPVVETLKAVSCARCARVSYLTHDGKRSIEADVDLYKKLCGADPMHASPLEHVATPDPTNERAVLVSIDSSAGRLEKTLVLPQVGNFLGWRQHRLEVEVMLDIQSFA